MKAISNHGSLNLPLAYSSICSANKGTKLKVACTPGNSPRSSPCPSSLSARAGASRAACIARFQVAILRLVHVPDNNQVYAAHWAVLSAWLELVPGMFSFFAMRERSAAMCFPPNPARVGVLECSCASMRLLDRYIGREVVSHAALGLAVFTFVFFVPQLVRLMDLIVRHSGGIGMVCLIVLVFTASPFWRSRSRWRSW